MASAVRGNVVRWAVAVPSSLLPAIFRLLLGPGMVICLYLYLNEFLFFINTLLCSCRVSEIKVHLYETGYSDVCYGGIYIF